MASTLHRTAATAPDPAEHRWHVPMSLWSGDMIPTSSCYLKVTIFQGKLAFNYSTCTIQLSGRQCTSSQWHWNIPCTMGKMGFSSAGNLRPNQNQTTYWRKCRETEEFGVESVTLNSSILYGVMHDRSGTKLKPYQTKCSTNQRPLSPS